jgi:DNA-binding transcriptional regulator YhcF (GntR family)
MSIPKYIQIRDAVLADIRSGRLKKGDMLPRREELVKKFSVTRTTIEKALEKLITSGVLETRRRLGTFVSGKPLKTRACIVSRYTQELSNAESMSEQGQIQMFFRALFSNTENLSLAFKDYSSALSAPGFHLPYDAVAWIQPNTDALETIKKISYKTVVANRYYEDTNFVSTNHREAISRMTSSYIELCDGSANLFYMGWDTDDFVTSERREGFVDACSKYGMFYRTLNLSTSDWKANLKAVKKLGINAAPGKPVIIITGSCNITGCVMKAVEASNLKLWKNFFYADFDNADSLHRTGIQAGTAVQDYYMMGLELVKAMKNMPGGSVRKFIPCKFHGFEKS